MDALIGIDLGGTALKYGLVGEDGTLIYQSSRRSKSDQLKEHVLSTIEEAIYELVNYGNKNRLNITGIGLGTPGAVNVDLGELLNISPNFKDWGNINLKKIIEEKTKLPFFVDNDANLAAFGEYTWRLNHGVKNIIYVTIGTGIGGGIIIDGNLFRGASYSGAEIGHISIDYNGIKCNCGGTGCWERYASTNAMLKFYNEKSSRPVQNAIQFFERIDAREKWALHILEQEYFYLAAGISSLLNVFNPEVVVIGGGISDSESFRLTRIMEIIAERAMKDCVKNVRLQKAKLGNTAGILGAAAFAKGMI